MDSEENAPLEATQQGAGEIRKTAPPPEQNSGGTVARHWQIFVILFLILAVAGMYFLKNMAVENTRSKVTQKAAQVISEQNRSYLRLASIPFVWAVRSEMIRGNLDQVNQYLSQFVKEPGMKEIIVAGPDGVGIAATNKKLEGASVTDSFPLESLKADVTMVSTLANGDLVVTAPVMGLNSRLGTLILVSSPAQYSLEVLPK